MSKPIVIALSGKKGAGKNTIASTIRDYFCRDWYTGSRDREDAIYLECAFADLLKSFCIDVLGLEYKQCYGTDEEKNTPTKYLWENTPAFSFFPMSDTKGEPMGPMSGREVMQIYGTESVRAWFGNVWAKATLRYVLKACPALAVITDNRFPSEVKTILGHPRGHVIRLTRSPLGDDQHASETSLDDFDWNQERCYVLDNVSLDKQQQREAAIPILETIFRKELGNE